MHMYRVENGHRMYITGGPLDREMSPNKFVVTCESCTPERDTLVTVAESVIASESADDLHDAMVDATEKALAHSESEVPNEL